MDGAFLLTRFKIDIQSFSIRCFVNPGSNGQHFIDQPYDPEKKYAIDQAENTTG